MTMNNNLRIDSCDQLSKKLLENSSGDSLDKSL